MKREEATLRWPDNSRLLPTPLSIGGERKMEPVKTPRWLDSAEKYFRDHFDGSAGSPKRIARICCEVSAWYNDKRDKGETVIDVKAVEDGLSSYSLVHQGEQPYKGLGVIIETTWPHRALLTDTEVGMKWNDQMRADLLTLYVDKLRTMSEEEFWDQFDTFAEESKWKVEADHYQARLTIAYEELGKRGIKTDEARLGVLSAMIECANRCDIRVVEAKNIADYLDRYYKRERRTSTLLGMYEDEFIREGYIDTSHHDNVTGSHIYWPNLPPNLWESMPEIREHRNLIDTIVGDVYDDENEIKITKGKDRGRPKKERVDKQISKQITTATSIEDLDYLDDL